jgi:4-amino-4-deoxy-L-arabinose transferase-like glycosyltransferase
LAAGGALVAAYVSSEVLQRMPHVQDSVAYLFQAKTFALGRLTVPVPPVPAAFQHEFVLMRDGQWFSKYPPGFPLLLAVGVLLGGPWLVNPLLCGLAIAVTYVFARSVYGGATALLGAALLTTSPWLLLMSGSMMSHPAGLVLAMTFVWGLERAERRNSARLAALSGFALGWLLATRALTAVALAAPMLGWVAVAAVRARRLRPRHAAFAAGATIPVLGLVAYNAALTGSPLVSPFELWWGFDRVGFGADVGMHGGHYLPWGLINTWANLAELERWLFGWPVQLSLAFALLPLLTGSRDRWDWLLAGAVLSLIAAHVAYWADGIMYGPRYYYEALGMLAVLTARGATRIGAVFRAAWPGSLRAVKAGATVAPALAVGMIAVTSYSFTPGFLRGALGYNGMDRSRTELVEAAGLHRALVVVSGAEGDWQTYGSVFWSMSPLLNDDVIYARDLGERAEPELEAAYPDRVVYRLDGDVLTMIRPPIGANWRGSGRSGGSGA